MFGAWFCILCERRGPSCCGEWAFVVGSGFGSGGLCDCRLLEFARRRCDLRGGGASLVSWDWFGGWGGAVCPLKLAYGGEGGIGVVGEVVCAQFCYLHLVVGFHYSWVSDILA